MMSMNLFEVGFVMEVKVLDIFPLLFIKNKQGQPFIYPDVAKI